MGDPNEEIKYGLRRPRSNSSKSANVSWGDVNPGTLRELISVASQRGGAVRFGLTRDGGAYAIGVYYGNDYWTDYVRPGEDITQYLIDLTQSFLDADMLPKKDWKKGKK